MVCLYCGGKLAVFNSRRQQRSNQIWRRRRCLDCGAVFTSHESLYLPLAFSVNGPFGAEPFIPERLFADILLALADRKDCYEAAREITATITQQLIKTAQKPLFEPREISLTAGQALKRFNQRAWLRYIAEHPSLQAVTAVRRGRARS